MGNYTTKYCTHENPIICDSGCDGDMVAHTKREIDKVIREGTEKIHNVEKYIIRQGEIWDIVLYWSNDDGYEPEFDPKNKKPTLKKKKAPSKRKVGADWDWKIF